MLTLPEPIAAACAPLFDLLPLDSAMTSLLGSHPKDTELVEQILGDPAIAPYPELAAGLWLYVDNLERSHAVSQQIQGPVGAYWHGIMHRREGDYANSLYWMRRAAQHPVFAEHPELDPTRLVEDVAATGGHIDPALVARQRREWQAVIEWCAAHSSQPG